MCPLSGKEKEVHYAIHNIAIQGFIFIEFKNIYCTQVFKWFLMFCHHVLKFGHQESYNIIEPLSYIHFFILTPTFFLNLHVLCSSCSNPSKILSSQLFAFSNTFGELIDTQFEWFNFHDFIVVVFVKFQTRIHTFGFLFLDAYLRFNTYL